MRRVVYGKCAPVILFPIIPIGLRFQIITFSVSIKFATNAHFTTQIQNMERLIHFITRRLHQHNRAHSFCSIKSTLVLQRGSENHYLCAEELHTGSDSMHKSAI